MHTHIWNTVKLNEESKKHFLLKKSRPSLANPSKDRIYFLTFTGAVHIERNLSKKFALLIN